MEDGAQSEEPADAGCRGQRRSLGTQARHSSEDTRTAASFIETSYCWVSGAEIDEEVAPHDVVVAFAGRRECGRQRLDRMHEGMRQRMLEWRTAPASRDP